MKIEKLTVPNNDFTKKLFPSLCPANKNIGILNASIVVPIGIFSK